ncbi:MAG TPA: DUF1178 family protein [Burkholderiaceae bacterium]|jgi:hypothetical protein
MLVLNLNCAQGHGFEGWFGSADDFESQRERGLVSCPVCANAEIKRMPSAPRLNVRATEPAAAPNVAEVQARVMQAVQQMISKSEDVGKEFAAEARRIHYGRAEERSIRGEASRDETEALLDEGIPVLPLPAPADDALH